MASIFLNKGLMDFDIAEFKSVFSPFSAVAILPNDFLISFASNFGSGFSGLFFFIEI